MVSLRTPRDPGALGPSTLVDTSVDVVEVVEKLVAALQYPRYSYVRGSGGLTQTMA